MTLALNVRKKAPRIMNYIPPRPYRHVRRAGRRTPDVPLCIHPLIASFSRARDLRSLCACFDCAAAQMGFRHHAIVRLSRTPSLEQDAPSFEMVSVRYPDRWVRHYQENSYAAIDPVHRTALVRTTPYRWRDIALLNPPERRVLDEAQDAGLTNGISVPVHEPMGRTLLFSLTGSASAMRNEGLCQYVHLISTQFYLHLERLEAHPASVTQIPLTQRELECLTWTARGKSSWDIGILLGISEHTVNFHLKGAMTKLHTRSRVAAAVKAATQALIRP